MINFDDFDDLDEGYGVPPEEIIDGALKQGFNAVEITERSLENDSYSSLKLCYTAEKIKPKLIYKRRYSLEAEFDSVSRYFRFPAETADTVRKFVEDNGIIKDFPPSRPAKKKGSYGEVRIFMDRKLVARIIKSEETKEKTEALRKILMTAL